MKLITIEQARQHCNAEGDDDDLLTVFCNAAEARCAALANRRLYKTTDELQTAVDQIPAVMATAHTAYDTAMTAAAALTDARDRAYNERIAMVNLTRVSNAQEGVLHGLALDAAEDANGQPANDDIIGAILLCVGHFYRNREEVVTGQGAAATEVPNATKAIMEQHRWIGYL